MGKRANSDFRQRSEGAPVLGVLPMSEGASPDPDLGNGTASGPEQLKVPPNALVVEDNFLIALECEEMLRWLGASTVHLAVGVDEAMAILDRHEVDFAIVDVNLGPETSAPVASRLHSSGVPFLLATGYRELIQTDDFADAPILAKPYTLAILMEALSALFAGR